MDITVEKFAQKTLELLEHEREAEIQETSALWEHVSAKELQQRGVCLLKLRVSSQRTGLYGRTVLAFETYWPGNELPAHNFTPGDIVGMSLSNEECEGDTIASGVITRVRESVVSVAFEESCDGLNIEDSTQYKLIKLANNVTYRRLKRTLQKLTTYRSGYSQHLIDVLFGQSDVGPPYATPRNVDGTQASPEMVFFNPRLDTSQREAVGFALRQREVAIIHGPPGTGKTTTVVEVIQQAVKQKLKILVCAPSNIAVDNLLERLAGQKVKVIRLGHPARLLPSIQCYSLDAILAGSDEAKLVADVKKDMDGILSSLKKARGGGARQRLRDEMKTLRKELRQREDAATKDILKRADVVMATLTGATDDGPLKQLAEDHFDIVIVDECSQAVEAACWQAMLHAPRCILAGDHNQLRPTIISNKAAKEGLAITLMERTLDRYKDRVMRMLTVQYRMNDLIMQWSSDQLYDGKLVAHESVAKHLLRDLSGVSDTDETATSIVLIDTAGCHQRELELPDEVSKGNEGEADLVTAHVDRLVSAGVSPQDIAVIAPYNLQVELLRLRLSQKYPKLEIKSVDGFQGREKEAVVISFVRSNEKGEVGFLASERRINVAITRARRHLAVICDTETVGHNKFLKSLVEYLAEHGDVRSAEQYIQEGALSTDCERPERLRNMESSQRNRQTSSRTKTTAKCRGNAQKAAPVSKPATRHTIGAESTPDAPSARELELQRTLVEFQNDSGRTEYAFPATLNARDRYLVHEVAERLGLTHLSRGEGPEREIVVNKPDKARHKSTPDNVSNVKGPGRDMVVNKPNRHKPTADKDSRILPLRRGEEPENGVVVNKSDKAARHKSTPNNISIITHETQSSDVAEGSSGETPTETPAEQSPCPSGDNLRFTCDNCGRQIPTANKTLHTLRCRKEEVVVPPTGRTTHVEKPKPKKQPKSAKKKKVPEPESEEDFDAMIAAAMKENVSCASGGCKTSTAIMGQNCPFCARRFCLRHHIPEVHGCGDRAKARARALISRDGVLYPGSGVPSKKPDATTRAHLQRRLDKKLTALEEQRKHKKKEK